MAAIQFRRAVRQAVKLKIGIDGPSGAGKTEGALAIARGITNGGRVAVADSENESASYYADRYEFDTVPLLGDVTAAQVREVIRAAVEAKYDVLVIDSLSRVWTNIVAAKDAYDLQHPTANKWTTWGLKQFGPAWDALMKDILDAPIHIIATMRSKQAHEQVEQGGKKQVVKLGLQPQVREGAEYEFGLVFSVNVDHVATATKDRTHLFGPHDSIDLRSPELHARLIQWMNTETPATDAQLAQLAAFAEDGRLTDDVRAKVKTALAEGIGEAKAGAWIKRLTDLAQAKASAPATTTTDQTPTDPTRDGVQGDPAPAVA